VSIRNQEVIDLTNPSDAYGSVRKDSEAFFLVALRTDLKSRPRRLLDRQGDRWSGIVSGRMELLVR
jgi:hypothetical protein